MPFRVVAVELEMEEYREVSRVEPDCLGTTHEARKIAKNVFLRGIKALKED